MLKLLVFGFTFLVAITTFATCQPQQCMYGARYCKCSETDDVCEFKLVIEHLQTFAGYRLDATDSIRGTQGQVFYLGPGGDLVPVLQNGSCTRSPVPANVPSHLPLIRLIGKYDAKDCNTPLHIAAETNNADIVDELLKYDSSKPFLDAQNRRGETALHISCYYGYEGVVRKLFKKKASKNIENKDKKTPAQLASDRQHQKIVKILEGRISVFGISLPRRTTSLRKSESKASIVTL